MYSIYNIYIKRALNGNKIRIGINTIYTSEEGVHTGTDCSAAVDSVCELLHRVMVDGSNAFLKCSL